MLFGHLVPCALVDAKALPSIDRCSSEKTGSLPRAYERIFVLFTGQPRALQSLEDGMYSACERDHVAAVFDHRQFV